MSLGWLIYCIRTCAWLSKCCPNKAFLVCNHYDGCCFAKFACSLFCFGCMDYNWNHSIHQNLVSIVSIPGSLGLASRVDYSFDSYQYLCLFLKVMNYIELLIYGLRYANIWWGLKLNRRFMRVSERFKWIWCLMLIGIEALRGGLGILGSSVVYGLLNWLSIEREIWTAW